MGSSLTGACPLGQTSERGLSRRYLDSGNLDDVILGLRSFDVDDDVPVFHLHRIQIVRLTPLS
jgi:hypothetical protein